jgi:hypothetical protein
VVKKTFFHWIILFSLTFFSFFSSNEARPILTKTQKNPIPSTAKEDALLEFLQDKVVLFSIKQKDYFDEFNVFFSPNGPTITSYGDLNDLFFKTYQKIIFFQQFIDVENISSASKTLFNFQNSLKLRKNEKFRFSCDYQLFSSNDKTNNFNYALQIFSNDLMFFNNVSTFKMFFTAKNYIPFIFKNTFHLMKDLFYNFSYKILRSYGNDKGILKDSGILNKPTGQVYPNSHKYNHSVINSIYKESHEVSLQNWGIMAVFDSFRNYSFLNNLTLLINWHQYANNKFLTFTTHFQYNNFPYIVNLFGKKKYPLIEISLTFMYINNIKKTFFQSIRNRQPHHEPTFNTDINMDNFYTFLGFQKNFFFHYSALEHLVSNLFVYYIFSWESLKKIIEGDILMKFMDHFMVGFSMGIKSLHLCFILYNGKITVFSRLKMGLLKMNPNEIQNLFLDHRLKTNHLSVKPYKDLYGENK